MVAFGDRHAFGQRLPSKLIWTGQPQDFGTADYGRRRAKAITKHLSAISDTELVEECPMRFPNSVLEIQISKTFRCEDL
jgi:hypothetical protein